jgi:hypothetical protein
MAIDEALMEPLTHMADKVIDIDFGASQAQGGFTAHGHDMVALSTIEASVLEIAALLGIAACEHLVDKPIIVGTIVKWMMEFKSVPVIIEYLFEYIPSGSAFIFHS